MELLEAIKTSIIEGNTPQARDLAEKAVAETSSMEELQEFIENALAPGIREVGRLWEEGEYFLPELMAGAEAMKAAMDLIQPELKARGGSRKQIGKVVIGTVQGDIHDIGKTLVATMLSTFGFDVLDLGASVDLQRFVDEALAFEADIICMSALLTTTMLGQQEVINILNEKGLRDRFKVLVGGSPVSPAWAKQIGADGYGSNAMEAVQVAHKLVA